LCILPNCHRKNPKKSPLVTTATANYGLEQVTINQKSNLDNINNYNNLLKPLGYSLFIKEKLVKSPSNKNSFIKYIIFAPIILISILSMLWMPFEEFAYLLFLFSVLAFVFFLESLISWVFYALLDTKGRTWIPLLALGY